MTKVRTVHISKACREWEWREEQGREKRHENKNTYRVKELMVRVIRTTIHKCNRWVCIGFLSTPCVLCCVCVRVCFFISLDSFLLHSSTKPQLLLCFYFRFFLLLLLPLLLDDEWCYRFTRFIFSMLYLVCLVCACMLFFSFSSSAKWFSNTDVDAAADAVAAVVPTNNDEENNGN